MIPERIRTIDLLPALFFAAIGAAMHHTQGHNSDSSAAYTLFFYVTVAVMMGWQGPARLRGALDKKIEYALLAAVVFYSIEALIRNPLITYAHPHSRWVAPLVLLIWGALALSAVTFFSVLGDRRRVFNWAAPAAVLLLALAQFLVPLISTHPWIDVFVNNTQAVDHFLHGANPYTQIYPDIYRGRYDYKPGFLYFPGLLYWLAPFRALFGDIRYGYIFANLLIALGLHGLAKKIKTPGEDKSPLPWLAPLLWLSFPVTFFVLEQSWIDTVLVALAVLVFWSLEEEKWLTAGVLMGAAFSVKQYGFLVGLVACLVLWRRAGIKTAIRAAMAGALTAAVVILPFAVADWRHFYASTITAQTATAVRLDAYNATTFIARTFHWILPAAVRMAISTIGIAAGALYVGSKRAPGLADAAAALFLGYGTAFLFGKFAFCNYHYLLAGMLLLYLVGFSRQSPQTEETCKVPSAQAGT